MAVEKDIHFRCLLYVSGFCMFPGHELVCQTGRSKCYCLVACDHTDCILCRAEYFLRRIVYLCSSGVSKPRITWVNERAEPDDSERFQSIWASRVQFIVFSIHRKKLFGRVSCLWLSHFNSLLGALDRITSSEKNLGEIVTN